MYTVFLDTSVLISASLSHKGASFQILELCKGGFINGIISHSVVKEAKDVTRRKILKNVASVDLLIKKSRLKVKKLKDPHLTKRAESWISDKGDVHVLVAASLAKVDYLITLDVRDYIWDASVSKKSGLAIVTPGDFMTIFRSQPSYDL